MTIINLTPHAINLLSTNNEPITTILPTSPPARVSTTTTFSRMLGVARITQTVFGDVEDLPEPQEGIIYIVSRIVRAALPNRDYLFYPNELVRDENGSIVGCQSLSNS